MTLPDPEDQDRTRPHHPRSHGDPVHEEVETHVDPAVAEAVHSVRDRFGAAGLRDLITLAGYELDVAEQALADLRAAVRDSQAQEAAASAPRPTSEQSDRDAGRDADGGAGSR